MLRHNRFLWVVASLACLVLVVPAAATSLAAPEFSETPIITTTPDQINPVIDGNNVVWQDYRSKSYGCPTAQNCLAADIFIRDVVTGVDQRLTTNSGGSGYTSAPTVAFTGGGGSGATATAYVSGGTVIGVVVNSGGSGYTSAPTVAFTGGGGSGAAATVVVVSGAVQGVSVTPDGMDPDISGNWVVWRNWTNGKIIAHNLATGVQQKTSSLAGNQQMTTPAVSGNIVVWTDYRASSDYGNIYMRDMTQSADAPVSVASTSTSIPAAKKDKRSPDIDGNIVAWVDMRNAYQDANGWWHNPDIFMKNLTTGVEQAVCTDLADQYDPVVAGNRIYWSDFRNGNWDVYMYDTVTGVETRLSTNAFDQNWPSVDGDSIAWKETRSGVEDIYVGRLSTGEEQPLTADAAAQKLPSLDAGRIVWMDNRNGNWDIFMAGDTVAPVITAGSPSGFVTTTSTTLTASYSDTGIGIDKATAVVRLDGTPAACTVTTTGASCPVAGLSQGNHSIVVDVKDLSGNAAVQWSGGFTVDSVAPSITNVQPSGWLSSASTNVTATFTDVTAGINPGSANVLLNGSPLNGCAVTAAGISCPVSGLPEGHSTFSIGVADNAGNSSTADGAFDVDTTGPAVTAFTAAAPPDSGTATINAAYGDIANGVDAASIVLSIDGNPVSGCSKTATSLACVVTGQALGNHTVQLSLSDNLGNPTVASTTFAVVDTRAPVISGTGPTGMVGTGDSTLVASFDDSSPSSGVDTASVVVTLDGAPLGGCVVSAGGVSCAVTGMLDGVHDVDVTVSDNAGNSGHSAWSFTVSASGPVIDQLTPGNGSVYQNPKVAVSARITDIDGVDPASIGFSFGGADVTSLVVINGDVYTYNIDNLADGTYTAWVTASDLAGHPAEQLWSFTVASPQLQLDKGAVYWQSFAAYMNRELTVDYTMTSNGTGACNSGVVTDSVATNGVVALGPLPVSLGDLAPNTSLAYSFIYIVPHGVSNFRATSYAACAGDAGKTFLFPQPPPQ